MVAHKTLGPSPLAEACVGSVDHFIRRTLSGVILCVHVLSDSHLHVSDAVDDMHLYPSHEYHSSFVGPLRPLRHRHKSLLACLLAYSG